MDDVPLYVAWFLRGLDYILNFLPQCPTSKETSELSYIHRKGVRPKRNDGWTRRGGLPDTRRPNYNIAQSLDTKGL